MPRQYPPGFRNELVQGMLNGERVLAVRDGTWVPEQKLHRWKHQGLIDAGVRERNTVD
jgi:putative transposase